MAFVECHQLKRKNVIRPIFSPIGKLLLVSTFLTVQVQKLSLLWLRYTGILITNTDILIHMTIQRHIQSKSSNKNNFKFFINRKSNRFFCTQAFVFSDIFDRILSRKWLVDLVKKRNSKSWFRNKTLTLRKEFCCFQFRSSTEYFLNKTGADPFKKL